MEVCAAFRLIRLFCDRLQNEAMRRGSGTLSGRSNAGLQIIR